LTLDQLEIWVYTPTTQVQAFFHSNQGAYLFLIYNAT